LPVVSGQLPVASRQSPVVRLKAKAERRHICRKNGGPKNEAAEVKQSRTG
jgi:hypothetical protein